MIIRFALYKEPNRSVGSLRRNIRIYDNNVDSDNYLYGLHKSKKVQSNKIVHDQYKIGNNVLMGDFIKKIARLCDYRNKGKNDYVGMVHFIERVDKLCHEQNKVRNCRKVCSKINTGICNREHKKFQSRKQQNNVIRNQHSDNNQMCNAVEGENAQRGEIRLSKNRVQLCIMGHNLEALIDTGATLSVISKSLLENLGSLVSQTIDNGDIDSCILANGERVGITHKTIITFTLGNITVTAKFYILGQISIDMIIGCDIFEQLGAVIDFKRSTLYVQPKGNVSNVLCNQDNEAVSLGYLSESRAFKNEGQLITLAPSSSVYLEPKSSNRVMLKASSGISKSDLLQGQITVNEPLSLQLKTEYYESEKMTEIVTILRNDTCEPQCLLSDQCIMSIEPPSGLIEPEQVTKINIADKVDLTNSDLSDKQKETVKSLLNRFSDVFAVDLSEIGCTNLLTYDIRLKPNTKPIRRRPYKTGWKQREIIEKQVDEWVKCGIIKPSMSEWAFPCLLVNKKGTDKHRLCIDFRSLNSQSELPSYPLIDLEEFLADLGGSQKSVYYTTIDLKSAYLQVPLSKRSQELCSFVCSKVQFSFVRAPFGLCALPLVFARLIDEVLRGTKHDFTQSFLDDILIYSSNFEDHLRHIQIVLERLRKAGLTVEPKKTFIARKEIVFIGYTFSKNGITTDPSNIDKVKFPIPKSVKDVRSFLGLSNYYRRFIRNYATITRPLNNLLKKDISFVWSSEAQTAFDQLKEHLITSPILAFPDLTSEEPLYLTCDASLYGSGHVLSQKQHDAVSGGLMERVIAYGGRNFTETQQRYTVTERELLAVVFAVEKLDQYLRCKKFVIVTDHSSLQWLLSRSLSNINARLARWVLALSQYNFTVIYKAGPTIGNADSISRQQFNNAHEDISFALEPYINALRSATDDKKVHVPRETHIHEMAIPGLEKFNMKNVRQAQQNDYWFGALLNYIIHNELPISKRFANKVLNSHQNYLVIDNLLYHIWSKDQSTEAVQQLCITNEFKDLIWRAMHVVPTAGHLGITKTYTKLRNRYFWPKMAVQTAGYVQQCNVCAQANLSNTSKIPLKSLPVPTAPLENLHMDILRIATPSKGANYILVIICAFSKYVIARALKRKTCKSVAKAFFQHYVLVFGLPKRLTITQDNGGEFKGNFNQALQQMLDIENIFTTPYSPASNGMVERTNRTLISILCRYAMKEANKWAHYLPYAVLAMNSAISESTKVSPFEMIHGIPMREAIDIQIPQPSQFVTKDHKLAHKYWSTQLGKIRSLARDRLFRAKVIQKKYYDQSAKPHALRVGDRVYLKRSMLGVNEDPKLRGFQVHIFYINLCHPQMLY